MNPQERDRIEEQNRDQRQWVVYERAAARMVLLGTAPDLVEMLGLLPGRGLNAPGMLSSGFSNTRGTAVSTANARNLRKMKEAS